MRFFMQNGVNILKSCRHGLVYVVMTFCALNINAQEQVVWHTSDFAPYFIQEGPYKQQGIADRRLQLVIEGLSQFEHQIIRGVTIARSDSELVQKDNICFVARIRTKAREQVMVFTEQPIIYTLANGMITTRSRLANLTPYLNKDGSLSLRHFLVQSNDRLGIAPGRIFGPGIDEVLTQIRVARPEALVDVEVDNHFRSRLLKLMYQNGYQAILGYPEELSYYSKLLKLGDALVFLPITEEPSLVSGYVGCSKSELGRRVTTAVDQLLLQPNFRQKVQEAYRNWLDKDSLARYTRLVQSK